MIPAWDGADDESRSQNENALEDLFVPVPIVSE